jgi:proteasome lid subunit RPN8/RPN11
MQSVVFSERAYVAMMAEALEHIKTETGGVFLGHYRKDTWYVIESVDPGPLSVFSTAYFEYDTAYINRLVNKLNKIYDEPLRVIGLWHRHPGSMNTFSQTDDGTNAQYAQLHPEGAISALVNIDPNFRVTVYAVTPPCRYTRITYTERDDAIPAPLRAYASIDNLKENLRRAGGGHDARGKRCTLKDALDTAFTVRSGDRVPAQSVPDAEIESILELFEEDIEYLSELGIGCAMKKTDNGMLRLCETKSKFVGQPTSFEFITYNSCVYAVYKKQTFQYVAGMIKKAVIQKEGL